MREVGIVLTMKRNIKYLRLSLEDDEVSGNLRDESNSITNQRFLLDQYILSHPDVGTDFEEIIDDGFSGTSFQRPGMSRLLDLVEADQVDTILIKDLSRFGRNYLESGYYIELVMPAHGVRLIAVNDFYDTKERRNTAGDIGLAINNLKNEYYSRDLSMKVKTTNDIQRRNGQFNGRVPFGYLTGPTKHDIVIDKEAAEVVRYIFHLAADEGMNTPAIAKRLNEDGITPPSVYRKRKRGYRGRTQSFWTTNAVYNLLIKRIYTGSIEMYKGHLIEIGSKRHKKIPRDERIIIPNTHEAIVSESVFFQAQTVITRQHRGKNLHGPAEPMLAGYLKCGCCGIRLFRKHTFDSLYFCRTANVWEDGFCNMVSCDAKELEAVVFQAIQNLVRLADLEAEQRNTAKARLEQDISGIKNSIHSLSRKRKQIGQEKLEWYELFRSGSIDRAGFAEKKRVCAERGGEIINETNNLTARLAGLSTKLQSDEAARPNLPSLGSTNHLTPELLKTFVQKVTIGQDGAPDITFKVKNVFTGNN